MHENGYTELLTDKFNSVRLEPEGPSLKKMQGKLSNTQTMEKEKAVYKPHGHIVTYFEAINVQSDTNLTGI